MSLTLYSCAASSDAVNYTNVKVGVPNAGKSVIIIYRKLAPPLAFPASVNINQKKGTLLYQ